MRLRWPFGLLLAVTVLGTAGLAFGPGLYDRWQVREDEQETRKLVEPYLPAAAVLGSMPLPEGMRDCGYPPEMAVQKTGVFCIQGDMAVPTGAALLVGELRAAGAEDMEARCGQLQRRLLVLCGVSAKIKGRDFNASVGPLVLDRDPKVMPRGTQVHGGVGPLVITPIVPGPKWIDVPLPTLR